MNDAVQNLCRRSCWLKVRRILLKIGGMRKVNPELMSFIVYVLSKDTPAEGELLSVMILPVMIRYFSCGRTSARVDS